MAKCRIGYAVDIDQYSRTVLRRYVVGTVRFTVLREGARAMSLNTRHRVGEKPKETWRRRRGNLLSCLFAVLGLSSGFVPLKVAYAIPPFARQTGLECNACHTVYPQLTPFGRQFKLNGYTMGEAPLYKKLGAWLQGSFTHTDKDQTDDAAPDFGKNDNFAFDDASLFYGGTVVGKVGAFLQGTYDGIGKVWTWDNMDVRYADNANVGGGQLVYGVTLNNNPGVQDLWNTMPAWAFPFDGSGLAPTPAASPLIEGTLGQIAAGGSVYGMWNSQFYAELGAYHTLARGAIDTLADSADGAPKSDGVAPYWRFVWEPDVGANSLSLGTFGIHAALFPDADQTSLSDSYTDVGVDSQYQYFGERFDVTTRVSFVQEFQDLSGSAAIGSADQASNQLHKINASGTCTYDKTVSGTFGIAHTWGNSDAAFYGTPSGSPDSTALTVQGDWLPLNKSPWSVYPWFNPRFTAQYVHYFQFDGSVDNVDGAGRQASDNDTLFLLATLTL
jgi:hypothetical protein